MEEKKKKKKHGAPNTETSHDDDTITVAEDDVDSRSNETGKSSETSADDGAEASNNTATSDATTERYIRLAAEYDNFRKRAAKEREQLYQMATGDLMKEMLPVLDNLDRATEHRNSETSLEEYASGIALIEDQLRTVLSHAGLEVMEVVGQPFDPTIHDAVMQMESDEYESGTVAQEAERGYLLRGRVIRHAKVIVAK